MDESLDYPDTVADHPIGDVGGDVTQLLAAVRQGDGTAVERLVELIYDELRQAAGQLMSHEPESATLQPTALVHEAYLKLLAQDAFRRAANRAQLVSIAVCAMRRLLVDVARRRNSAKRGGDLQRVGLEATAISRPAPPVDLEALGDAIDALARVHERASQVITLRYFGAFGVADVARQLDVSVSTVEADFRFARAWLRSKLREPGDE